MEAWKRVFRMGVAPQLSIEQLIALRDGLADDDITLIQGATTTPPPLHCVMDWPCEAGCLIAYPGWKTGLATVGEVEKFFANVCLEADKIMGEPSAVCYLLDFFDYTPRDEMRIKLGLEVDRVLKSRGVRRSADARPHQGLRG